MPRNRSVVFIDGNNWYHGLKKIQVDSGRLDYHRVAQELLQHRELQEIRYYVGKVSGHRTRIAAQHKFLTRLESQGVRVFLGRIEENWLSPNRNPMARELKEILAASGSAIPQEIFWETPSYLSRKNFIPHRKTNRCVHSG